MKTKLKPLQTTLAILGAIFLFGFAARGQIFSGLVWVTNSAQAPVYNSFILQTNVAPSSLAPRTLELVSINTNQTFSLSYGYAILGSTNVVTLGTITTNFTAGAGFTNGQTVLVPIPGQVYFPAVVPYGVLNVGAGYSNQVSLQ